MTDLSKLPYAPWLEDQLKSMMEMPVKSIGLVVMLENGDIATSYYGATIMDKALFAGMIQQDAMLATLAANREDEEET